jgi:hypothetical protein
MTYSVLENCPNSDKIYKLKICANRNQEAHSMILETLHFLSTAVIQLYELHEVLSLLVTVLQSL